MVRIGLAGIGFMGMIHFLASKKVKGGKVTAICSRDPKKLSGDWRGIQGNFGPKGDQIDLKGVKTYSDFQQMIEDPDIDLVDICAPTDQHAPMAIAALKAGKHVLVEKAIALTAAQADKMIDAAEKAGKVLMVAHVLPFFSEFDFVLKLARKNTYGRLVAGRLERLISKPEWSSDIGDAAKTGGPVIDLHIHDTHFLGLLAGMPGRLCSIGVANNEDVVEYVSTNYIYGDNGPAISATSGAIAMPGRAFQHGFDLQFEKATVAYSSAGIPLSVYTKDGKVQNPKLLLSPEPVDAFTREIQCAVDGVKKGAAPEELCPVLAREALGLCFQECQSVLQGRPLVYKGRVNKAID